MHIVGAPGEGKFSTTGIGSPCIQCRGRFQSLGEGFLNSLASKGDYYGSQGLMVPKSGTLGGLEVPKSQEASTKTNIEAQCDLRYHPKKVYKAWAEVLTIPRPIRVTIVAREGWRCRNLGFWRTGDMYKLPLRVHISN